jgi:hypothetical protein
VALAHAGTRRVVTAHMFGIEHMLVGNIGMLHCCFTAASLLLHCCFHVFLTMQGQRVHGDHGRGADICENTSDPFKVRSNRK